MESVGKIFLLLGFLFLLFGTFILFGNNFWFGRLPGDFLIKKGGFTFYFPLSSSLVLSLLLSLLLTLFYFLRGR